MFGKTFGGVTFLKNIKIKNKMQLNLIVINILIKNYNIKFYLKFRTILIYFLN